MMTKTFTIDGRTFDVAMASAVNQDKILSLLSRTLVMNSLIAKQKGVKISEDSTLIMMTMLPSDIKEKIVPMLTEKAFEVGKTVPVTIKDFEGKMVAWNRFLSQLIAWNFSDFFDLLASAELGGELTESKQETVTQ